MRRLAYSANPARIFYVATNGNDQWSGKLATPDSSGNDGPFVTLKRARNAIRELRARGYDGPFTVLVRDGIYELDETFILDTEDSGTQSKPFVVKAYDRENPVLSGSRKVNGFQQHKEHIYKADLSGIIKAGYVPRQLFAAGKRQILARYPNLEPLDPIGGGFLYAVGIAEAGSKRKIRYRAGDVRPWWDIAGAEIFIFPGHNWGGGIRSVESIDEKRQTIVLGQDATNEILPGNRFYFQNLLEELDSPGEWYYDRKTSMLYFWPPTPADLESVYIPVVKTTVEIRAKKLAKRNFGNPSFITFEGFTLRDCDGGAIILRGAKDVKVSQNTIYHAGGHGIEISGGFNNEASNNSIYSIGGTGIVLIGGDMDTLVAANHRAINNHIHDTGVFEKSGASGILCWGVGNTVSNNYIHSMPRVGVWLDGNDHLIEYNHIHHVNQETQDSGIIYFGNVDWTKRGNVIRYNYLHDSGGYGRKNAKEPWQAPFETYGVYMDDWTSGTHLFGNLIVNTVNGGVYIHGGRDNIIENNIIIDGGRAGQMVYSAWPADRQTSKMLLPVMYAKSRTKAFTKKYPALVSINDMETGAKMSGNQFIRNIVYYTDAESILFGIYNGIDERTTISNFNTIYSGGKPIRIPYIKAPVNKQWGIWRKMGFDKNSIIADPKFINAPDGNYSLSPDSPAFSVGFKPIPLEKIGQFKKTMRASQPMSASESKAQSVSIQ